MLETTTVLRNQPAGEFLSERLPPAESAMTYKDYTPIEQRSFLSGGVLKSFEGAGQKVFAPFKNGSGEFYLGSYPDLGTEQALDAINAAERAYDRGLGPWPQMSPEQRIACLEKFVAGMIEKREQVAELIMLETAKPLPDSYAEFDRTVEYIRSTIEAYREIIDEDSGARQFGGGLSAQIDRTPLGVTLCMGPFNYPLNETFTSLVPALLAGNTVVMKPARFGVLLFSPLLESFRDSFPEGAVNVVYGDGAKVITPIMQSGKVDVLAFIGSTRVADLVSSAHPEPHRLTKILGLGAHNPSITLPGTDIDRILPELKKGSITFNGQRCTTLALHFVHESQGEEYAEKLAKMVGELKEGLPWEDGVSVTALAEGPAKIAFLQDLIDDAVLRGARIVNSGGGTVRDNIMTPAVLYPVTPDMRIFSEEQFGPVIPVCAYSDVNAVLRRIADSRFGQQISIFGDEPGALAETALKARNLAARLNLNSQCQRGPDELPFTGKKDSGLGVLSIRDAIFAFSCPTVIASKG